jgi:hypothetical protein
MCPGYVPGVRLLRVRVNFLAPGRSTITCNHQYHRSLTHCFFPVHAHCAVPAVLDLIKVAAVFSRLTLHAWITAVRFFRINAKARR